MSEPLEEQNPPADFSTPVTLGKTGLLAGRLGLGAGYGAPVSAFEAAFDKGCNYFYWSGRKPGMKAAIANICARGLRDRLIIAVQSYAPLGFLLENSLAKALKALNLEYADVFLLGWRNKEPSQSLLDKALELKQKGMFRFLGMSGHHRPLFARITPRGIFDLFHIRYNAAHVGAETEAFPHLKDTGVVTYTATRWGHLLNPKKMPPGHPPLKSADCYRFVLSNPAVHICLCGPENQSQMDQALEVLHAGPMDEKEMARVRKIGEHVHRKSSFFF